MAEESLGLKIKLDNPSPLTEKQKLFAKYYVECGRAKEAADKAGYKGKHVSKTAGTLLKKPAVRAEIARIQRELEEQADLSLKQVIEMHRRVYYEAMLRQDFQAAERAAEALGRIIGAYQDNKTQRVHFLDETVNAGAGELDSKIEKLGGLLGFKVTTGKVNA